MLARGQEEMWGLGTLLLVKNRLGSGALARRVPQHCVRQRRQCSLYSSAQI